MNGSKLIFNTIIVFFLLSNASAFACYWNPSPISPSTQTISLGNTVVQRDAPVGSVLLNTWVPSGKDASTIFTNCQAGDTATWILNGAVEVNGLANTYMTDVPGVGIKIKAGTSNFYYGTAGNAQSKFVETSPVVVWTWSNWGNGYTIQLIKTASTGSGDIGSQQAVFSLANLGELLRLNISGQVTTIACQVTTPNIQVPLDDLYATELNRIGATGKAKTFDLGLNCDSGTRINVMMSGVQNTNTSADGVLQLTNAGAPDVSSGIGIQILYNNSPIKLNNTLFLKTSAGGQETLPFTAQYYQTNSQISAGSANATATFTLTYQ